MNFLNLLLHIYRKTEINKRRAEMAKLSAIEDANHLLNRARQLGDSEAEAGFLIELGNVYAGCSDYKMSDAIYGQALELARQIRNNSLEIVALLNLGLSFKNRIDFLRANSYYQEARLINEKMKDDVIEQKINEHIQELGHMRDIDTLSKLT
jgi:tetratricopeptide (TPR) repeat protein